MLFRGSATETHIRQTKTTTKHALSTIPIANTRCLVAAPQKQQEPSTYAVAQFMLAQEPIYRREATHSCLCVLSLLAI